MKSIMKITLASCMLIGPYGFADSSSEITHLSNTLLNQLEMPKDSPDWLKRTSINVQFETDFKPIWEIETVQPIYQFKKEDMMFWQFNANTSDEVETYNFGLGYRSILNSDLMLGINSFYDYQEKYEHRRWSLGVEAIGQKYEFRANRYMAISDKKEVQTGIYEEVLDGWDVEVGGQLIPNSKLKTYYSYTLWEGIDADDLKQQSIKLEYPLNDTITFEAAYINDNEEQADNIDKNRFFAQLSISLGKKSKSSKNLDRSDNLYDKLLIPVKRENKIVVERKSGLFVVVKRGT